MQETFFKEEIVKFSNGLSNNINSNNSKQISTKKQTLKQMPKQILTLLCLSLALTLSSCSKDKSEKPESSSFARFLWSAKSDLTAAEIKIINQYGEPIPGAQILIGDAQGTPFRNNFLTTDKLGLAIIPMEWTTPASVTVHAGGYIRQTLLHVSPGNLTLKMNTAYLPERAELRGQVTQLPVVNLDKLIDFALVMPVLTKSDLLNFDIGQVISPYTDLLNAAGQNSEIASNISLPKQNENYIINITLNKPVYRLKVPTLGPKKVIATRGRFVFKTVAAELRKGKPFYELINHFSILGGSTRDVTLTSPLTTLNLPANELVFDNTLTVNSTATQADEMLLVLATNEIADSMIPTDIKRATNGQATMLQSMQGKPTFIVSVIKKQSEFMSPAPGADRMSASLVPYSATAAQALLPLIDNPTIINSSNYIINLPKAPVTAGINALAITASISDLVESKDGSTKVVIVPNKKWDIIGLGWNEKIALPKWPLDNSTARKRVEVNYIGSITHNPGAGLNAKSNARLDDGLIEKATHVTHASTDF